MIVTKSMISMNLESITRTPLGMVCTEGGFVGERLRLCTTSQPSLTLGSSPSRGALGRPSRFRGLALRSCWLCWRKVLSLRQEYVLER